MNTQDSAQESARTTTIMPKPSAMELLKFYTNFPDATVIDAMQRVIDTYIKPLYEHIKELEQAKTGEPEGLYLKVVPLEGYQVTDDDVEPGGAEMVMLLSDKKEEYYCCHSSEVDDSKNDGWTHIITGLGRVIKKLNEQHNPYKEEFEAWFKQIGGFEHYTQSTFNLMREAYYAGRANK